VRHETPTGQQAKAPLHAYQRLQACQPPPPLTWSCTGAGCWPAASCSSPAAAAACKQQERARGLGWRLCSGNRLLLQLPLTMTCNQRVRHTRGPVMNIGWWLTTSCIHTIDSPAAGVVASRWLAAGVAAAPPALLAAVAGAAAVWCPPLPHLLHPARHHKRHTVSRFLSVSAMSLSLGQRYSSWYVHVPTARCCPVLGYCCVPYCSCGCGASGSCPACALYLIVRLRSAVA
jgi:hypothetical protein